MIVQGNQLCGLLLIVDVHEGPARFVLLHSQNVADMKRQQKVMEFLCLHPESAARLSTVTSH
jgi:hypothetical protein